MKWLPWLLPLLLATNLVAASFKQRQASSLSLVGVEIEILALIDDDEPQALDLDGLFSVGLSGSANIASGSPLSLQDSTGYLYSAQLGSEVFASGYAMLVIPAAARAVNFGLIELVDAAVATPLLGTVYLPLVCAPAAGGVLTCGAGSVGSTLRSFGTCALANVLAVYNGFPNLILGCGGALNTINTFEYTVIRSIGGGLGTGASGGGSTGAATSAGQGSCSVTLMLYLETSTTYVPVGHVGTSSTARGGSLSGFGCSPITSTLHLN